VVKKVYEKSINFLLQTPEYGQIKEKLHEIFHEIKPELTKIFSEPKYENMPKNDELENEFSENNFFDFDNEKTVTVEEIEKIIAELKNCDLKNIENLGKISTLDLIWHEKFSELLENLFNLLENMKFEQNILEILQKLINTSKSNNPMKFIEIYAFWLKFLINGLQNSTKINENIMKFGFEIISNENKLIIENEYLICDENLQEIIYNFYNILCYSEEILRNEKISEKIKLLIKNGILQILNSDMISRFFLRRKIRKFLMQKFNIENMNKISDFSKYNLENIVIYQMNLKILENICIHYKENDNFSLFLSFLMNGIKLFDKNIEKYTDIFENILQTFISVIQYDFIKISKEYTEFLIKFIIENMPIIKNLHIKSVILNLLSNLLSKISYDPYIFTDKILGEFIKFYDASKNLCENCEFNSFLLEFIENLSIFCIQQNTNKSLIFIDKIYPQIMQIYEKFTDLETKNAILFLFLKIMKNNNEISIFLSEKHGKLLIIFLCDLLLLNPEENNNILILKYELENIFQNLILIPKNSQILISDNLFENLYEKIICEPKKSLNYAKIKQIFEFLLKSPTFIENFDLINSSKLSKFFDKLCNLDKPMNENLLFKNLKILKKLLENPMNQFCYQKYNIENKLQKILQEISYDISFETEITEIIKNIIKINEKSIISAEKISIEIPLENIENLTNFDLSNLFSEIPNFIEIKNICNFLNNLLSKSKQNLFNFDYEKYNNLHKFDKFTDFMLNLNKENIPNYIKIPLIYKFFNKTTENFGKNIQIFDYKNPINLLILTDQIYNQILKNNTPKIQQLLNYLTINCYNLRSFIYEFLHSYGLSFLPINYCFALIYTVIMSDKNQIEIYSNLILNFLIDNIFPMNSDNCFIQIYQKIHEKSTNLTNFITYIKNSI